MRNNSLSLVLSSTLLGAVLGAGCSPYNPALGDEPFRCGASAPFCPIGYSCQESGDRDLCIKNELITATDPDAGMPDAGPDGGPPFTCGDDSQLEPNESLTDPTDTNIPASADRFSVQGLSICPVGDTDVFVFSVNAEQRTIRADLTYLARRGELALDLLNADGASIRAGTPFENSSDHLVAELPEVPVGVYYVQVKAAAPDAINNYGLSISVTGP